MYNSTRINRVQSYVSLRRYIAITSYTSNMVAVIIVDRMTALSSHVLEKPHIVQRVPV